MDVIVRPADENGDMMPVAFSSQMLDGAKAVAQVVKQRLQLYYGEWWEDESEGFRILPILSSGVKQESVQMLAQYITSYVAGTVGVTSVTGSSVRVTGRTMTYKCTVHVGEESETVEVNLDGLL